MNRLITAFQAALILLGIVTGVIGGIVCILTGLHDGNLSRVILGFALALAGTTALIYVHD